MYRIVKTVFCFRGGFVKLKVAKYNGDLTHYATVDINLSFAWEFQAYRLEYFDHAKD
jgi:hypothetical protein